jgi:hypothetical protein
MSGYFRSAAKAIIVLNYISILLGISCSKRYIIWQARLLNYRITQVVQLILSIPA